MTFKAGHRLTLKNLVGAKFSKLTVIALNEVKTKASSGRSVWNCICDCGNFCTGRSYSLLNNREPLHCGCSKKPSHKKHIDRVAVLWKWSAQKIRSGAKSMKRTWNLTIEETIAVIQQPCHYCGSPWSTERKDRFSDTVIYHVGIDRKDNTRGYEPDNVLPCCFQCNKNKLAMTYEEYIGWIKCSYNTLHSKGVI